MKFLKIENSESDPHVKVVSLNRSEVKNAFNPEMIAEITFAFRSFNDDSKIKIVILKGEGNVFCAGADLNWMKKMAGYSYAENVQDSEKLWDMFQSVIHCEAPVVAIAHGAVYGGAIGLLACCDYVVAEEKTKFCFSEVKLGLAPAVISSFILRKMSDAFVRPYMLSGAVFATEKAITMGLLHELFKSSMAVTDIVKIFSSNGTQAMRETKKLLNALASGPTWNQQMGMTTKLISERRVSDEGQALIKKFLDKI